MTTKVCSILEQVQALKEFLEERSETLTDKQAVALQVKVDELWGIADRRGSHRSVNRPV